MIKAIAVFVVGFAVGHSTSIDQHRARCAQLGGVPVVQVRDYVTTVYCQPDILGKR